MSDHFYFTPPRVLHVPLRPPRKATPGEGIYLQLWKEFAESRPKEWHAIFQTNGPVRQRAASVAASFMAYMGCGGGRDFTFKAEAAAAQESAFGSREAAFLATWAVFKGSIADFDPVNSCWRAPTQFRAPRRDQSTGIWSPMSLRKTTTSWRAWCAGGVPHTRV